jgi:glycerol dehydratase large subunit
VIAHSSDDMPTHDLVFDLAAADSFLAGEADFVTIIGALQKSGFDEVAGNILNMGRFYKKTREEGQ